MDCFFQTCSLTFFLSSNAQVIQRLLSVEQIVRLIKTGTIFFYLVCMNELSNFKHIFLSCLNVRVINLL